MKNIKLRLIVMNFLQFFIWGAWLCTLGLYMTTPTEEGGLAFDGALVGSVFALSGIASLIMPALIGIVSDKWINAERLMGGLHFVGAIALFSAAFISDYDWFKIAMLVNMLAYMPTLSLSYTVAYNAIDKAGLDRVKDYPPVRVWGTVGFIVAMWIDNFTGFSANNGQLIMAGVASVVMGFYCFTLPACPPAKAMKNSGLLSMLGLDALSLFKNYRTAVFLLFSFLLGAALQVTNMYGVPFLDSFKATSPDSWAVKYAVILSSLSQVSETLFILAIPFFMSRYGIKRVMIISFMAWVLRFGFFAIGGPEGFSVLFLILSMIVYGMAFDFFNVSGSLFIADEAPAEIKASAQGIFMMMTNGLGSIVGGYGAGWVIKAHTVAGVTDWTSCWTIFAGYALVIGVLFALTFHYKHQRVKPANA
ncbi:nucleoside permease [Barnesiella viscericola]|uniref:Nucleoside permease n=1 Tax=Barnesiella viscericola TaxID=397865 RepID=A0A921MSZ3_9BACT|nr:nucleoside permease [Barnesiella viscericola]HJG90014.1 nucleoside permease [Barnesiella viscericola]